MRAALTHSRVKELVHYDPEKGVFTWAAKRPRCRPGDVAGSLMTVGYVVVMLDGRKVYGHRLAWFYVHGVWPRGVVDHKNHVKHDNRIDNLRDATVTVNLQNRVIPLAGSKTGVLGASTCKGGRFRATIKINKKFCHLGVFDTPEEAGAAYLSAKKAHHPGYVTQ